MTANNNWPPGAGGARSDFANGRNQQTEFEAHVAALVDALDDEDLQEAWQAGRGMDMDTAIAYAISL